MGLPYKGKNHTALRAPLYIGKNCRFSVLQLLAHCSPIAQILSNPIVSLSLYLGTTQRSFHNFLILNIIILCHPSSDRFLSIQNRPPNAQLPRHLIASSFSNRSTITQQLLTHRSTPSSSYRFSIASLRFSTASPPHVCPIAQKTPRKANLSGRKRIFTYPANLLCKEPCYPGFRGLHLLFFVLFFGNSRCGQCSNRYR